MRFSQKVKNELNKIRETGKDYKQALQQGIDYGREDNAGSAGLIPDSIYGGDEELGGIFLRGVFISCGSVTDPSKDYHLELVPPNSGKCSELLDFMNECGLAMKKSIRKSQSFVYCKGSERIIDFLTFIGATKHSMELMNVMIYKEIRNNVNRAVNCEAANIDKTTRAAGKQISDIEYIFAEKGEKFLKEQLREVALVRRSNPDMSLYEVGMALKIPISKSGVNHRLRKISQIAEELRRGG
jgi:hypothetical protein